MEEQLYYVVKNLEDQYSIWAEGKPVPLGWKPIGNASPKDECLMRIEEVWTDMTPKSVREHLDNIARQIVPSNKSAVE